MNHLPEMIHIKCEVPFIRMLEKKPLELSSAALLLPLRILIKTSQLTRFSEAHVNSSEDILSDRCGHARQNHFLWNFSFSLRVDNVLISEIPFAQSDLVLHS